MSCASAIFAHEDEWIGNAQVHAHAHEGIEHDHDSRLTITITRTRTRTRNERCDSRCSYHLSQDRPVHMHVHLLYAGGILVAAERERWNERVTLALRERTVRCARELD